MSESSRVGTMPQASAAPVVPLARWVVAIFAAGILAWAGYQFPPHKWVIPDDMTSIGALSPPEDQARLKVVMDNNLWMNTLLKFTLAGAGFGLAGFFLYGSRLSSHWKAAIATLLGGAVAGCLSGVIGLMFRKYLDQDHPLPLISAESRPLVADTLVYIVNSALLLLPIALLLILQPDRDSKYKASAIPLAGLFAGVLVPLAAAIITTVLSTHSSTSVYPPYDLDVSIIWFGMMSVMASLLIARSGSRVPKNSTSGVVGG